jgi:hypothetical protein
MPGTQSPATGEDRRWLARSLPHARPPRRRRGHAARRDARTRTAAGVTSPATRPPDRDFDAACPPPPVGVFRRTAIGDGSGRAAAPAAARASSAHRAAPRSIPLG